MKSLRRILLIGTPFLMLTVGMSLNAAPKKMVKCGQPATRMAAFMQKLGLAGRIKPCETASPGPGSVGEWCTNPGNHCADANGSGKCTTLFEEGVWSCVCQPNGKQ
jgi:hypothetical protein